MPTYPISNVTRRVVYTGSAGVGPYAFTFEVIANTDVAVYKNATLLTLTTDYTVTINANGTGSVTLVSAATGSDRITIVGNRAVQRTTDFVTGGDLFANTLNDELDSQTIFVQQVAETTDRSIRAPVTDPTSINMVLPNNTDRANKALVFDANGNPLASTPAFPGVLTATYYPRVNAGGTVYELRAPSTVRADIGADNASNLASGTVADARLPSTMDSKTLTNVSIPSGSITGGSITGITDLAIADGGTGASTAADARTNLGLGTISTQSAASVAITGGSITGITDLAIADGGTGASNASGARTNLGLGSLATQNTINNGDWSGADLAVANGGTGSSTAADARTNLGLGTISTQSAASVSITGGTITGITDLAVADGGTGASTAAAARVNLLPSYTSNGGKVLAVNVGATDVEWIAAGTGTVTSITAGTGLTGGTITSSGTIAIDSTVATLTGSQTLTNKRITARVSSTTSITSPLAWNSDNFDQYAATAQAGALTINADSGTPTDGQKMVFRFKDNGTARALTWTTGASKAFRAIGITLPTTTVISKTTYVGCIYNAADDRWDAVATVTEA